MKRFLILVAACCAAMSVAATTAGAANDNPHPGKVAKEVCVDMKNADRAAFEDVYGEQNAMRECKRSNRGDVKEAQENAVDECRAEQEDEAAFAEAYGSGKNAFGKCVSSKRDDATDELVEEYKNAVEECRAEQEDEAAFAGAYGSGKNAFGKCVSAKAQEDDEETAPTA